MSAIALIASGPGNPDDTNGESDGFFVELRRKSELLQPDEFRDELKKAAENWQGKGKLPTRELIKLCQENERKFHQTLGGNGSTNRNGKVEREANTSSQGSALYPPKNAATVQPLLKPPKIAYEPRILDRFREAIRGCGVVGEDATAATLYLLITSRLLDKPVSAAVKGLSSSGKSFTTEKVVEFFSKQAVIIMTAMSERALVYSKEEYTHRTLILYEATALREGAEDNLTAYFVRSLLSEGRIEYPVTVRDPKDGGFITKTVIKEGPTNPNYHHNENTSSR
jgi:hypothetical protein